MTKLHAQITAKDADIKQLQAEVTSIQSGHRTDKEDSRKAYEDKVKELEMEVSLIS